MKNPSSKKRKALIPKERFIVHFCTSESSSLLCPIKILVQLQSSLGFSEWKIIKACLSKSGTFLWALYPLMSLGHLEVITLICVEEVRKA